MAPVEPSAQVAYAVKRAQVELQIQELEDALGEHEQ